MKIENMSSAELLQLMADITSILQSRAACATNPNTIESGPAKTAWYPQTAAKSSRPDDENADFCLMIAERIRNGGYVKAQERERVAEIAKKFPHWVKRQGLPETRNAGDWERMTEYASGARRKER